VQLDSYYCKGHSQYLKPWIVTISSMQVAREAQNTVTGQILSDVVLKQVSCLLILFLVLVFRLASAESELIYRDNQSTGKY
jgi:hypothetical protein